MNDKDILDKIKKSSEGLEPPSSLSPDNMSNKLKTAGYKKKKRLPIYRLGIAAALLLTVIAVWSVNRIETFKLPETEAGTQASLNSSEASSSKADSTSVDKTEMDLTELESSDSQWSSPAPPPSSNIENRKDLPEFASAKNYEEVFEVLKENFHFTSADTGNDLSAPNPSLSNSAGTGSADKESSPAPEEKMEAATESSMISSDYSATNLRAVGVDEGDIIKTDGNYLYVLNKMNNRLEIVQAEKEILSKSSSIILPSQDETIEEFYIDGNTLNLITSKSDSQMEPSTSISPDGKTVSHATDIYQVSSNQSVLLYTYDISDRKSPRLLGSTSQEGTYRTSRKVGNYVYLFTEYFPTIMDAREDSRYIPQVGGENISPSDIYLPKYLSDSSYLLITSTDNGDPGKIIDQKAILSAAYLYYVSTENIYICNNSWNGNSSSSQLLKFHYENGLITPVAAGNIKGSVNDSFSMDEYNGYLRVVVTSNDQATTSNALYVLDKKMKVTGSLQNLAPGETIQSARFMGDSGYFVTYRQMDPLFSVDLKDPKNPKILGELKITGFSSYLHFYGKDKLLGIGYETDPDTGSQIGLKLSMFDISDPKNVRELHKYVVKNAQSSEGLFNYKAIMMNPDKNIFGLHCLTDQDNYMVFSYDPERGFINEFLYSFHKSTDDATWIDHSNTRGLYIGDTFYLSYGKSPHHVVDAFDMKNDYGAIGSLTLP